MEQGVVDLRSDTVTRPCEGMREAMRTAEVGDAVYGEDPTVNRLEQRVARLLGKESALYVASGTMANTLAIRLCVEPGDEVVCEANCHPVFYEAGGSCAFSGVLFKTVTGSRGIMDPDDVEAALYDPVYYRPRQRAVLVENTHNRGGGAVYPLETLERLVKLASGRGLRLHMDGARLWNASVASGMELHRIVEGFDTVSVCFSKGLGAPVGSVLAGSRQDIERAWHYRHMLGGSWRQAGILAAGALYALEHNIEGLAQDHLNAQKLMQGLADCGFEIINKVETNMVYFGHEQAGGLVDQLKARGVLMAQIRPGVIRCVTHRDVDQADIDRAVDCAADIAGSL